MYADMLDHFAGVAWEKQMPPVLMSLPAGAALAGACIGILTTFVLTVAASLPAGARPLVMGAVFGIGLAFVIFAEAELFTSYALCCTAGLAQETITPAETLRMLALVWVGGQCGPQSQCRRAGRPAGCPVLSI